jgi:SAM-dependent methyltransferase
MMRSILYLKMRTLKDMIEGPISLVEEWLLKRVKKGIILDFGCGKGVVMGRFFQRGYEAIGLEPKLDDLRSAKMFGEAVLSVGERLPFVNGTFDAVISSNVLHHMADPEKGLQEIHRCLKTGGYLLLTETIENNPFIRLARNVYPYYEGIPVRSRYRMEELKILIVKNHFVIVEEDVGGFIVWLFVMLANRVKLFATIFSLLLSGLESLETYLSRKVIPLRKYCQNYFVLAYKNGKRLEQMVEQR